MTERPEDEWLDVQERIGSSQNWPADDMWFAIIDEARRARAMERELADKVDELLGTLDEVSDRIGTLVKDAHSYDQESPHDEWRFGHLEGLLRTAHMVVIRAAKGGAP